MKYIAIFIACMLQTVLSQAMDFNEMKARRQFMSAIMLGDIENIDFSAVSIEWQNNALYIAYCSRKYDAIKLLLANKAQSNSIFAQLTLVDATLNNDQTACAILANTPHLSHPDALLQATLYRQGPLVQKILTNLSVSPESDQAKLAIIWAKYADEEEIFDELNQYIEMPSELDCLILLSKYNFSNSLYDLFLSADFSAKEILGALETAITHNAQDANRTLMEYIAGHQLLDEVIQLACQYDLDKTITQLLQASFNDHTTILRAIKIAQANNAQDTIRAIEKHITKSTTQPIEHPRVTALKNGQ